METRARSSPDAHGATIADGWRAIGEKHRAGLQGFRSPVFLLASAISAGSNQTPSWYAQGDMRGPKRGQHRNWGQNSRTYVGGVINHWLTIGDASICFRLRLRSHFVALSAYAYPPGVSLARTLLRMEASSAASSGTDTAPLSTAAKRLGNSRTMTRTASALSELASVYVSVFGPAGITGEAPWTAIHFYPPARRGSRKISASLGSSLDQVSR